MYGTVLILTNSADPGGILRHFIMVCTITKVPPEMPMQYGIRPSLYD